VVALGCKILRIIFSPIKNKTKFDGQKMHSDIKRPLETENA